MYSKETERGTISVSNRVFADLIISALEKEGLEDRIWVSNRKARILENENDVAASLKVDRTESGRIDLAFSIVVRFGESISALTDKLAERLAETIYKGTARMPERITIFVAGVKSRDIARRAVEVVKEYEPE